MEKIIIIICLLILITGCNLSNSPTSKVEEYLEKYQMLDKNINISYTQIANDSNLSKEEKRKYENLIKKQYKNLMYEIKDNTINGKKAIIKTEIEVINYKKVIEDNPSNLLETLNKTKEKITYTINFKLTKNKKGEWTLEELSEEEKLKLIGMK